MKEKLKKEALAFIQLMPQAILTIIGWEIGKWLFF